MNVQSVIPSVDAIPLPAPYWLLKTLLMVTLILHLIAMNMMVGSIFLAFAAKIKSDKNRYFKQLFTDLSTKIPAFVAATVTLGVAPLLFLQVLYGQFFYTSSVLMGWFWFSVVVILVFAYYGFYYVAIKQQTPSVKWVLLFSGILILIIGFFLSNNMTLMLEPAKWAALYKKNPTGVNLNLSHAPLIPRYLHFITAAVAVGGLLTAFLGLFKWKTDREYSKFLIAVGSRWFWVTTLIQIVIGFLFLFSLPKDKIMLFMGKNLVATTAFLIGIVGSIITIYIAYKVPQKEDPRKSIITTASITGLIIISMVFGRDVLRNEYLKLYFKPENFVISTQWTVLLLFLIFFIAGVVLWGLMLKKYFFNKNAIKQSG